MENIFSLVSLTIVLVLIPGPNVALIVANSLKHGTRFGLATVAGTTIGVALQLSLVVLGLSALLIIAAEILEWVKWIGAAYLVYIGVQTLREPACDLENIQASKQYLHKQFYRGLFFAVINPKTLIFNAAFIPQFVPIESSSTEQFAFIAAIFLSVLCLGDCLWAICAGKARPYIMRFNTLTNQLSGWFMIIAGIGLSLANSDNLKATR